MPENKSENASHMMDERQTLQKGDFLLLYSENREATGFRIEGVLGTGTSAVCYSAVRQRDGKSGKLKEFYPCAMETGGKSWCYSLERTSQGQLVPRGGTIQQFHDLCEQYLENYRVFNRVVAENPQNEILKNYIQDGEILYGKVTEEKNAWSRFFSRFQPESEAVSEIATVYIWTSGMAGENYDSYLDQIRKFPGVNPDRKLHEILQTMTVLADSIAAMHTAGLLHLDIKPSGFLIGYNSRQEVDPVRISMFDIDSIYRADDSFSKITGTDGYRAPEVKYGKADNRSDIYSLGAILFKAIVINEKLPADGLYRDTYYEHIDRYLQDSALLAGSLAGQDSRLAALLSRILHKCLAPLPELRYQNCLSLMDDLKKAAFLSGTHAAGSDMIGDNRKIVTVPKDETSIVSPVLAMQKLLHDQPLYVGLDNKKEINILLLGSGIYGQKFMDLGLQMGQMPGYYCNIFPISNRAQEFREEYLQSRPAMKRFVDVDGSFEGKQEEAYGSLRFLSVSEAAGQEEDPDISFREGNDMGEDAFNVNLAGQILSRFQENGHPVNYVFVALGIDRVNQRVAGAFSKWKYQGRLGKSVPVVFVSEHGAEDLAEADSLVIAVPVMEPVTLESIDPQLLQMAFNAHLSWISSRNIDVEKTYREFLESRYELESSVEYALSIQYKLYGAGIRIRQDEAKGTEGFYFAEDFQDAAAYFDNVILSRRNISPESKNTFDSLVVYEHRRWLISMAAKGWNAPLGRDGKLDLNKCVSDGKVRNESDFTHPCMVRSREGNPLQEAAYQENDHVLWETAPVDPALDELDQMSLTLHQAFRKAADSYKKQDPLYMGDVKAVGSLVSPYGERVRRAFDEFRYSLKNILEGVESYSRQYRYYEDELKRALEGSCPAPVKNKVTDKLDQIRKAFFPVIEANLFRNYKNNDVVLLENTPFIMTYRAVRTIVIPFEDGRNKNAQNEAVFTNVASATMLSPSQILYLYRFTPDSEADHLMEKISCVIRYLDRREVRCDVMFIIGIRDSILRDLQDQLEAALHGLADRSRKNTYAGLKTFKVFAYPDSADEKNIFARMLKEAEEDGIGLLFDASNGLFDSSLENGDFVKALQAKAIPCFAFEPKTRKFSVDANCGYLKYVKNHSCLRVGDVFTLLGSQDGNASIPEYAKDYEYLWSIYSGRYSRSQNVSTREGMEAWNALAKTLARYFKEADTLTRFSVSDRDNEEGYLHFVFYIPEIAFSTISGIVEVLKTSEMCGEDSYVEHYTSQELKVSISVRKGLKKAVSSLFGKTDKMIPYYGMRAKTDPNNDVYIKMDSLVVKDVNLEEIKSTQLRRDAVHILNALKDKAFIRGLNVDNMENPKKVSFTICSPRIKKILTEEGMILEIYTYYQALKTGYFDDVACGYRFTYGNGSLENELDVVMTKGFRTIIMECKGKSKVDVDTVYKLDSVVSQVGIAPVKVLVTKEGNAMRKGDVERGKMVRVITVSDEKISDIGEIIMKKLESTR